MSCLKFYLYHILISHTYITYLYHILMSHTYVTYLYHILLVAFFSWLESPSGPRLHHFQCIVIIARLGLHGATLHATHQQVHLQLLTLRLLMSYIYIYIWSTYS